MLNDAIEHVNRDFDQSILPITGGGDPTVPAGYNSILMLRAAIIVGQSDTADPDKYTQYVTQDTNIDPRSVLDALRKRIKDMMDEYNSYIAQFGSVHAQIVGYDGNATANLEDAN